MGGRVKREGTYVYIWLIHVDVWKKPVPYCKAIIPQIKTNKLKSFLKGPVLDVMLFCHHLGILNNFLTRAPNFHLVLGPTNHIAGPGY